MEANGNEGSATVWGIDLGTTYSCIARVNQFAKPEVINNEEGDATTPSVVMFADADSIRVGKSAKQQMQMDPDNVCELVKRNMDDPDWRFAAHGNEWSAPQISAEILKAVANGAGQQTREQVKKVIITIPAYFGISEREATKTAGEIADLEVVDIINEPTAAAFSYGFAQEGNADETVLVYDLGGGTFDISVIQLTAEGAGKNITVIATGGDHRLGGAQWDEAMVSLMAEKFMDANPDAEDPMDDEIAVGELGLNAEDAKRALSQRDSVTEIVVSGATRDNVQVTREEFDKATEPLLTQTIAFTRNTVEEAKELGAGEIDRVLLVGGSTFMPHVRERLHQEFGWEPELQDPNQAVAKGAALLGAQAELRGLIDSKIAEGRTEDEAEQAVAEDKGMPLAEVRRIKDTNITNVCSRGFGLCLLKEGHPPGGTPEDNPEDFFIDHVITPQTQLPADPGAKQYATVQDNQAAVNVQLWQQAGTSLTPEVPGNEKIGEGTVSLPGSYPAGEPFEVRLAMAEDGVLNLSARHASGEELKFTVASEGAVTTDEDKQDAIERSQALTRL